MPEYFLEQTDHGRYFWRLDDVRDTPVIIKYPKVMEVLPFLSDGIRAWVRLANFVQCIRFFNLQTHML